MNETRIFRFSDPQTGAPQIVTFPVEPPKAPTDLEVRIEHFTEIENFSFLAHMLAHELGEEELAAQVLEIGIRWEHLVASTNDQMIPGDPLKIRDAALQARIDAVDEQTEVLVIEINRRSVEFERKRQNERNTA